MSRHFETESPAVSRISTTMADVKLFDVAPLTKLPNELLDAIASRLDKPSLCNFASTSKKTTPSATNALYRTYINREASSDAPFALFLRTVCDRPDLAAKVKFVDIGGWRSEYGVATGAAWRGIPFTEEAHNTVVKKSKDGRSRRSPSPVTDFTRFVDTAVKIGMIAKCESYSVPALK